MEIIELDQFKRAGRALGHPKPSDFQDLVLYEVIDDVCIINYAMKSSDNRFVYFAAALGRVRNVATGEERNAVLVHQYLEHQPDYIGKGRHLVAAVHSGMSSDVCLRVIAAFERAEMRSEFKHRLVTFENA